MLNCKDMYIVNLIITKRIIKECFKVVVCNFLKVWKVIVFLL